MTGMRSTVGIRPLATAALGFVILVSACGGSASPAPSQVPGGSIGPGSSGPLGTPAPGSTTTGANGGLAFGGATTALDALDSYEFRVEIATSGTTASVVKQSRTVMSGVVINRPTASSSLVQEELDTAGAVTSHTATVIIGANAWVQSGSATGPWTAIPAAQADLFVQGFAAYRPERLFGLYFAGLGGNFTQVGPETRNGVATVRYKGDDTIGVVLGTIAGFQGTWTSDVWIARDGGFLVHSEASGTSTGTDAASFLISVDVTKPNAAGPIVPPS